jgi:hypothetical protein
MDYYGSESGQTWIKVGNLGTGGRKITKWMSKRNWLRGGQVSGLGKLAGSCEHSNEHLVHKMR